MEDEGWEKEGGVMMVIVEAGGDNTMTSLITRLEATMALMPSDIFRVQIIRKSNKMER